MSLRPISAFPENITDTNNITRPFSSYITSYNLFSNYGTTLEALIACTYNSPSKAFNTIKYPSVWQYIGDTVYCKIYKGYVPDHPDTTADNGLADGVLDEANLMAQDSFYCAEEDFTSLTTIGGVNTYGLIDCTFNFDVDLSSKNLTAQVSDIPPCFTVYLYAISGGSGSGNASAGTVKTVGWTVVTSQDSTTNAPSSTGTLNQYPNIFLTPEDDRSATTGGAGNLYYHVPSGNAGDGATINDMAVVNFSSIQDRALACEFYYRPIGLKAPSMIKEPRFHMTDSLTNYMTDKIKVIYLDDLKQQVDRLEWRVDLHEEQLKSLQDNAAELKEQLDCINKSLAQIKWLVVGGAVVYWGQAMGLGQFLQLVGV